MEFLPFTHPIVRTKATTVFLGGLITNRCFGFILKLIKNSSHPKKIIHRHRTHAKNASLNIRPIKYYSMSWELPNPDRNLFLLWIWFEGNQKSVSSCDTDDYHGRLLITHMYLTYKPSTCMKYLLTGFLIFYLFILLIKKFILWNERFNS